MQFSLRTILALTAVFAGFLGLMRISEMASLAFLAAVISGVASWHTAKSSPLAAVAVGSVVAALVLGGFGLMIGAASGTLGMGIFIGVHMAFFGLLVGLASSFVALCAMLIKECHES